MNWKQPALTLINPNPKSMPITKEYEIVKMLTKENYSYTFILDKLQYTSNS